MLYTFIQSLVGQIGRLDLAGVAMVAVADDGLGLVGLGHKVLHVRII